MASNKNLDQFFREYFNKKKSFLQQLYPGITVKRLKGEFDQYYLNHFQRQSEFFSQSFIQYNYSPVQTFLDEIEKGIPLEYISSRAFFYTSEFFVNSDVLIPRSETEILVELAIEDLRKRKHQSSDTLKVLDIGTGPGTILLSITKEVGFPIKGIGFDICKLAIKVAKRNLYLLEYSLPEKSCIEFVLSDCLKEFDKNEKVDLIVSNPPYIKESSSLVHSQVREFEPHKALFLPDGDYNKWFCTLFSQVEDSLKSGGAFIMEGHEDHLEDLQIILSLKQFKDITIHNDYTNRKRFLKAYKNG